ncbi:DDE-type integrase/transposase/recombinase [Streptomyces sp. NPDC058439]|uniref:DDE-type integrase/transposase/recombinase n=1 Tax=Streptomyces sp. NPDC058439 TaxID=3346500 RepID=UPI003651EAE3
MPEHLATSGLFGRQPAVSVTLWGRHLACAAALGLAPRAVALPVASAPNRCWVADFTHVATWSGVAYVAFIVDTFSRRIVGWSASTAKETRLILDALKMALWQRDRHGFTYEQGELIHHSDAKSQYTSFAPAEHLDRAGIAASIGSIGDAYDCQSLRTGSRKDRVVPAATV